MFCLTHDVLLETAMDNVNNLQGGKKWKFKAISLLDSDTLKEVTKYEIGDVTGF